MELQVYVEAKVVISGHLLVEKCLGFLIHAAVSVCKLCSKFLHFRAIHLRVVILVDPVIVFVDWLMQDGQEEGQCFTGHLSFKNSIIFDSSDFLYSKVNITLWCTCIYTRNCTVWSTEKHCYTRHVIDPKMYCCFSRYGSFELFISEILRVQGVVHKIVWSVQLHVWEEEASMTTTY